MVLYTSPRVRPGITWTASVVEVEDPRLTQSPWAGFNWGAGAPIFGVNHAGIGLRWRGHADDGNQPRVQWYPLGAATEFTLQKDLSKCRWRILPGRPRSPLNADESFPIELGKQYVLKGEVLTLRDGRNRYRNKIWAFGQEEPESWAVESLEQPSEDFPSGSALLVAHHSDVTFGSVQIHPLH